MERGRQKRRRFCRLVRRALQPGRTEGDAGAVTLHLGLDVCELARARRSSQLPSSFSLSQLLAVRVYSVCMCVCVLCCESKREGERRDDEPIVCDRVSACAYCVCGLAVCGSLHFIFPHSTPFLEQ